MVLCIPILLMGQGMYQVRINLTASANDQLQIAIDVPTVADRIVEYHMPKVVPGTYSISDFGRFVSDFKALDSLGNELPVEKISTNRWQIQQAGQLKRISYTLDDTFDGMEGYIPEKIFEPGGTSFEADRNIFILNTFGVVGYLEGYTRLPYQLYITHDPDIYGGTSLERALRNDTADVFHADNYHLLADSPIMYCKPDTLSLEIADARILLSVCSPNERLSAEDVMDFLEDLMVAQSAYFNDSLPVNRYTYLIYLMDYPAPSGKMGALEHSYSSLYTFPEMYAQYIGESVRHIAAHEFLHIMTPLNIHSEEIHDFNFIEPDMSRHLWLYEGVTEYSAMHLQVRNGLHDEETFLETVKSKISSAANYPQVSFTEMSDRILEPEFEPMYANVYEKGALIGLCFDLYLLKYSNGMRDLPGFMQELARRYGPTRPFRDNELFEVITEMTYPEVGDFFQEHVVGDQPLPLKKCLSWAGITYTEPGRAQVATLGEIGINVSEETIVVSGTGSMNDFGRDMGYEEGDRIIRINGRAISLENAIEILDWYRETVTEGDKVTIVVERMVKGKVKTKKLSAKAEMVTIKTKLNLKLDENASDDQLALRHKWLNGPT